MKTNEFLHSLAGKKEFSDAKQIITPNENSTCYFLAGVKDPKKRNMDNEIIEKNYFAFDFDIRNWFKTNEGIELTDDEVKEEALSLGKFLLQNPYMGFEDWRYIVFSGGGFHLYYVGDILKVPEDITPREYSSGVLHLQEKFQEFMKTPYLVPDKVCRNIARIFRLPGTTNLKYGNKCEILAHSDRKSEFLEKLRDFGKKQLQLEDELSELKAKKYNLETTYKLQKELIDQSDKDFLDAIMTVPVEKLLIESGKIQIKGFVRNKNFVDPRDNSFYGFWKAQDGNYIVVGGSTTLAPFSLNLDGLNAFSLVKGLYNLEDRQVYDWFRSYFSHQK